jgi:hypothetical protein
MKKPISPVRKSFKTKQRELLGTLSYHRARLALFVLDADLAAKYPWAHA